MKVWLVKLGEPLPSDGAQRLHRYGILSSMLAESGHEVVYWTSTFDHFQKKQRASEDKNIRICDNYSIFMIHTKEYKKNYSFSRILHHRDMARKISEKIKDMDLPDVIVTSLPTGEVSLEMVKFGKKNKIPVIADIRDLWPDVFIGSLPDFFQGIIKKIVEPIFKTRKVMKNAYALVGISKGYLNWGLNQVYRNDTYKDKVFYMGYPEIHLESKLIKESEFFWDSLNITDNQFICCFFGSINRHYNFNTIISAIKKIQKNGFKDVRFVLCGTGDHFERVKDLCKGISQMVLPGWVDMPQIVTLMRRSKIGLCPYSKTTKMALPNKPFEYFAGGIPILSTLSGELDEIINKFNVGKTYDSNDPAEFYKDFLHLYKNKTELKEMSGNARKLYEECFSAKKVYSGFIKYIEEIVGTYN